MVRLRVHNSSVVDSWKMTETWNKTNYLEVPKGKKKKTKQKENKKKNTRKHSNNKKKQGEDKQSVWICKEQNL